MNTQLTIRIILGICILLVSISFGYYRIVREKRLIIASLILSTILGLLGVMGRLGYLYHTDAIIYTFMFGPLIYFTIFQGLRYFYRKDSGKEPIITYASKYDYSDGNKRIVTRADIVFTLLLLILTFCAIFFLDFILNLAFGH